MILFFAWTSSPEYSAGLHCDLWQVHMHLSVFGLSWKALNREKGCLLKTWARKRACQCFVWSIQSKRSKLFCELKLVTDNLSLYLCSSQLRSHWKIWKAFFTTVQICQWLQNLLTSSLHLCLFCSLAWGMEVWEHGIDYIMAYGSTTCIGWPRKKNGGHIKSAQMTCSKCLR